MRTHYHIVTMLKSFSVEKYIYPTIILCYDDRRRQLSLLPLSATIKVKENHQIQINLSYYIKLKLRLLVHILYFMKISVGHTTKLLQSRLYQFPGAKCIASPRAY